MSNFNSNINGNDNTVIQKDNTTNGSSKTSGWTKTSVIATIVIGIVTLLFTYIKYHSEINEWFSKIF